MNTLRKLLSVIVAEDLSFMCEHYALLPDNHFGGRPGRCTTDAMHLLVHRTKAAWHRHNVAAILFLDVEGAFPNAVSARLLHNMRMCRVPKEYVLFMDCLLTNQCTWLKFDGYTSDWINVDNGIVQGDPLSGFVPILSGFVPILSGFVPILSGLVPILSGFMPILSGLVPILSGFMPILSGFVPILSGFVPIFIRPSPSSSGRPHLHPAVPIFIRLDHPHRPVRPARPTGPTGPYWPLSDSLHELSYVLFP